MADPLTIFQIDLVCAVVQAFDLIPPVSSQVNRACNAWQTFDIKQKRTLQKAYSFQFDNAGIVTKAKQRLTDLEIS